MIDASVAELRQALDARKVSATELAHLFLNRIDAHDAAIHAFITIDREGALAAARAADERLARGERAPLLGIPFAHKDIFCTEGVRTTCGSKMLENFISPYDAHVVSLLKAAGAVSLGKLNLDEFAMGSSTETSYFGATHNPWRAGYVPGGSSGGSAAAVAARLVPLATGTDTGGSVRQPAAFCGITGIKPTYGTVSRYGMIAYASSCDQGGAFGASAQDCAALLEAMSGFDERDSTSLNRPAPQLRAALDVAPTDAARPLAGLKLGVPVEFFRDGLHPDVARALDEARRQYEALGAQFVEISLEHAARLAIPAYYVLASAEASSNLSRYDGVRYGHRAAEYDDLDSMYCNSRSEGFGAEVRRRILIGTYVLSHGYYDAYYLQAQRLRRMIAEDFRAAFAQCDLIFAPVSPTPAWKIGEKVDDPVAMYLADIHTLAVNLAGLPGLSHPCGFSDEGLPIGAQLIGPHFSEARLLEVAHRFQQSTDWHCRRPVLSAA